MSGFNLPPGCSASHIPGNTRADQIEETIYDAIYEALDGLSEEQQEVFAPKVRALIQEGYEDGYQQARADAAEEKADREAHEPFDD